MNRRRILLAWTYAAGVVSAAPPTQLPTATPGCQWAGRVSPSLPGLGGAVYATTVFNDGGGDALYVGGSFRVAGDTLASNVARWNGTGWTSVGSGTNGEVHALTVFDDGGGPALYAAGYFSTAGGVPAYSIAKWDGRSWSALGSGLERYRFAYALTVFDDGGGPALYAGGYFTIAGGVIAKNIAKWDGTRWMAVGPGLDDQVEALAVFDDGSGPALYAGGYFTASGSRNANRIAKWNGTSWSTLGLGIDRFVRALTVFDDGGGPALYAGGYFSTAGGVPAYSIAKWDGTSWSALGSGLSLGAVDALTVFDDGGGPALYAGGEFHYAGSVTASSFAKWDGKSWSALGSGLNMYGYAAYALTVFDDGGGPALYAGGYFTTVGGVGASNIAEWDGTDWSALGSGTNSNVEVFRAFDNGKGPALYAGGTFITAGAVNARGIAKWDGSKWWALGSGMSGTVYALTVFDDGNGAALYAGGWFGYAGDALVNSIARWNGTDWSGLGSGMGNVRSPGVGALTVFDDGSGAALYAGGVFTTAGGVSANYIAKWDGMSWSPLGSGIGAGSSSAVRALAACDDGNGEALYAGGTFTSAGGVSANYIAKWDGTSWSPLGSGMGGGSLPAVLALTVLDDGGGPALYAGGGFTIAGGVSVNRVAKWDGTSWSSLGSGTNDTVYALNVFDDGSGPALYAGGRFTIAGGRSVNRIAKWDGTGWSSLGSGTNDTVSALEVFDDGTGPALYAGGDFTTAGGNVSAYVAKWYCPIDLGLLVSCLQGPDIEATPDCRPSDLDSDADVDLADFGRFQNRSAR